MTLLVDRSSAERDDAVVEGHLMADEPDTVSVPAQPSQAESAPGEDSTASLGHGPEAVGGTPAAGDDPTEKIVRHHLEMVRLVLEGKIKVNRLDRRRPGPAAPSTAGYHESRPATGARDLQGPGNRDARRRKVLQAKLARSLQRYRAAVRGGNFARSKLMAAELAAAEASHRGEVARRKGRPWPRKESDGRRLVAEMKRAAADLTRSEGEARRWKDESQSWEREAGQAHEEVQKWREEQGALTGRAPRR